MEFNTTYLNKTNNKTKRLSYLIKYLIIHHTAGSINSDIWMLWWTNPKSNVSVHFLIDKEWIIYQCVSADYIAYHTWTSDKWPYELNWWWWWNLNPTSIWIEVSNLWNWKDPYTDKQIKSLEDLSIYLINKYDIKIENVLWHKEITKRKIDPSSNFYKWDMEWFRNFLKTKKDTNNNNNNLNNNNNNMSNDTKYDNIDSFLLFTDLTDNKDIKRLIEIWIKRYYEQLNAWTLKNR